jgi:hypothetical protein
MQRKPSDTEGGRQHSPRAVCHWGGQSGIAGAGLLQRPSLPLTWSGPQQRRSIVEARDAGQQDRGSAIVPSRQHWPLVAPAVDTVKPGGQA